MTRMATLADKVAIEQERPWEARRPARTLYKFLGRTADAFPDRPAVSFQILSGPKDRAETLSWRELRARVTAAANMFRAHGIGEGDVVAYLLPNCNETVVTLLGGAVAGVVNPINPLLEPETIAAVLRETGAKALVTLAPFPKTDVAQKAAEAVRYAPNVKTIFEVDLNRYLSPPKSWLVPFVRPKLVPRHTARVLGFNAELRGHRRDGLDFADAAGDRVAAAFHTGGTTGTPKVAQHRYEGMIYNGWCAHELLFNERDVLLCPLPLFHVLAAYPVLMTCIASGAHLVLPTPAGYRGEGVFDNFWKLVERWGASFMVTVPTAVAALMQRKVNADVSSLKTAICGSAALPVELFNRFREATGVEILEGYGMTEATCLVSCNPFHGEKKVGSVGIPFPHTDVRILDCAPDGSVLREMGVEEVGEICVSNPGVWPGNTYMEPDKNAGLYADGKWLRTGDLGRIDADGYIWITGRAKDLIIRGGHNIDPAQIEQAMAAHPAVAFAGAIGQPDAFAGELPCVYVELVAGAQVTEKELEQFAAERIHERAATPKHVEILPELPKTAVGKVLKNELRKLAIRRVYNDALAEAGIAAEVTEVYESRKRGLVARLKRSGEVDDEALGHCLGQFTRPWEWDEVPKAE